MSRIKILSRLDKQNYEKKPEISEREWNKIITGIQKNNDYFCSQRLPATEIAYVIQYGYFKHSQRFFPIKAFTKSDLKLVSKVLNIPLSPVLSDLHSKTHYWRQNKEILKSQKFPSGKANNIRCRSKALVKELRWNNKIGEYYVSIESLVNQEVEIMFRHRNLQVSINGEKALETEKVSRLCYHLKKVKPKLLKYTKSIELTKD